ncbi:MAG: GDSL-type esterase/lipase family protein [Paludibacteraceae bacterium]|nr:GDSL-type esterase/lipase family protein [Paludibacteraceae bacterium]
MRRFFFIVLALAVSFTAFARIPESGWHFYYAESAMRLGLMKVVGRSEAEPKKYGYDASGYVRMDWGGSYIQLAYQGKALSLRLGCMLDTEPQYNWYNIWFDSSMDAQPDTIIRLAEQDCLLIFDGRVYNDQESVPDLFESSAYKTCSASACHQVIIQKRTEAEHGIFHIGLIAVDGLLLPLQPDKTRLIEFIGDSYSTGYGIENCGPADHFTPETQNPSKTYAAILARYFDADYITLAHSGMGVIRNYNSKFPGWTMPLRYRMTFDMDSVLYPWVAAEHDIHPSLTVIMLGGNDFSCGVTPDFEEFKKGYWDLLLQIKANYGADYPILCVTKPLPALSDYVRRVVEESGMTDVCYFANSEAVWQMNETDLGADRHPNYNAHRKLAHTLIPYVSTITGWELTGKPIE